MNKNHANTETWVSAQIGLSVIAWLLLGGPTLIQLVEAGLAATVPISAAFLIWRLPSKVSDPEARPLKRRLVKNNLAWVVAVSILILLSWLVEMGSYIFNLSLYVISIGYMVGFYVVWTPTQHGSEPLLNKSWLAPLVLVLLVIALLIVLIILMVQTPWYPHAMSGSIASEYSGA